MWSIGSFDFSEDVAYACEPFVTAKNGLGFVRNGKIKNIFALSSRKGLKMMKLTNYWNSSGIILTCCHLH